MVVPAFVLKQTDTAVPEVVMVGVAPIEIVTVPVICTLHNVTASVASTLYVVADVKFPVGRLMVPPVPPIAMPTIILPVLFLN